MNAMRIEKPATRDHTNFEIEFYQAIVNEAPDYVDALMLLGEAYTRKGLHERGLKIDKRLTSLRPKDPIVFYNLACSYSLMGRKKEAIQNLHRSIRLGYLDLEHMATDPDLSFLHGDKCFQRLLRRLGKKILKRLRHS